MISNFVYTLLFISLRASKTVVSGVAVSGVGVITRATVQFSGFNPAATTRSTMSLLYMDMSVLAIFLFFFNMNLRGKDALKLVTLCYKNSGCM